MPASKCNPPERIAVENPTKVQYCSVKLEANPASWAAIQKSLNIIDQNKTRKILTALQWAGIKCVYWKRTRRYLKDGSRVTSFMFYHIPSNDIMKTLKSFNAFTDYISVKDFAQ